MKPSKMPVLNTKDFLDPPSADYEIGNQRSTVGWLKALFQLNMEGDLLIITNEDNRDYADAISLFKRINKIGNSIHLHAWEDETSAIDQRIAFNKFGRAYNKSIKGGKT